MLTNTFGMAVAGPPTASGPKPLTQAEIDKETQRMKRARTLLLIKHPFFGYLAMKLKLVATDQQPTMATDGKSLWFNPRFTSLLEDDQTLTGFVHEVMHCVSEHFDRQGTREGDRWKKACDHAINPVILKSGFKAISIPGVFEWLCDPAKFGGKTAEACYEMLPPEPPGKKSCGCVIIRGEMKDPGKNDPQPDPNQQPQTGGVGTAVDPSVPPPAPPVNWKRAVVEAAIFARNKGKLPGHLEELIEAVVHPRTDWKRVIRSAFSVAKKTDWSWRRPNRRYVSQGIILPTPHGYTTSVEWWGDTSGSVGAKFFALGLGGAVEICRQLKITLDAGVCDAAVQGFWTKLRDADVLKEIKFLGRGGTDFRPIFRHVKEGKRKPDCIVVVTDLYGTFPEKSEKPPCQVIWMAPDTSKGVEVPFGQRLFVNLKELGV